MFSGKTAVTEGCRDSCFCVSGEADEKRCHALSGAECPLYVLSGGRGNIARHCQIVADVAV